VPKPGETCYTCGSSAVTDDHIPARCLFPEPRPANLFLIKVPSCSAHNHERGGDDDYFRMIMAVASADNPVAEKWIEKKMLKYLKRNPKELMRLLAGSHPRVPVTSTGGIVTGYRPAFTYDRPRLQRVVDAYARGIWYFEHKKALPQDFPVWEFDLNPNIKDYHALPNMSHHVSADRTFSYGIACFEKDPRYSMIAMRFYEKVIIVTGTGDSAGLKDDAGLPH
jgi:hypothetical protein